jgi:2'-hydroxyisoflavone reductase
MRLLILGGTAFLGRHLTQAAVARGHSVTLFNRGRRNPDLFPDLERLIGERPEDLAALRGRKWEAAIDTSGYTPRAVGASAGLLAEAVEHYTFVSSLSVYSHPPPNTDESGTLSTLPSGQEGTQAITGETYGPLKVLAEQAAEAALPGRVLMVRSGLIVGPHDPSDRFTYWPSRVARGGEVLAPDAPDLPVQFIDVRDLASWILDKVESRQAGVFNVTGPQRRLTMGEVLETSRAVAGADARFTWISEETLLAHNVAPYSELPLWVPRQADGFGRFNCRQAIAAGLTFRPLAATVRATLEWDASRPQAAPRQNGLRPEREAEILAAWHAAPA